MKTQNKTAWLLPYVESVKDIVPFKKIKQLKGYKVSAKRDAVQYGSCSRDDNGHFTINMRLYRYCPRSKQHIPLYIGHLLETFAHELSHTIPGCWNHSAKHMKYTGIILQRFSNVIKKQGIKDTYGKRMKYE